MKFGIDQHCMMDRPSRAAVVVRLRLGVVMLERMEVLCPTAYWSRVAETNARAEREVCILLLSSALVGQEYYLGRWQSGVVYGYEAERNFFCCRKEQRTSEGLSTSHEGFADQLGAESMMFWVCNGLNFLTNQCLRLTPNPLEERERFHLESSD